MIKEPLSIAEVKKIVDTLEKKEKIDKDNEAIVNIKTHFKKFLKIKPQQAEKLKQELEALDLIKVKKEHIIKIMDLLPEDVSDMNKIFTDVSLDENETNKILEVVKKYP